MSASVCPQPVATTATAATTPLPVLGSDVTVPLVTGGEVTYAALDYAASAPALQRVWDDVAAYAPYYGSVHRGAGYLSQLSTDLFENSRRTVAEFLDCRDGDQVVFTRSTTDSLNLLAAALPADCQVFVFETEHHASLLPWRDARVTYLNAPRTPGDAVTTLERALADRDPYGPALVCVTGASNVTGELWPVKELAAAAHAHGARIVLDAAQLAPHHPVSVQELDVDWVAFSGHKLYAPFGSGVLAGRSDWLRAADPYLAGGGASRKVARRADGGVEVEWHTTAARHEAGSPNVIGVYAIAAACRALTEAGFDGLVAREQALVARVRAGLAEVPEVKVLSLFGDDAPRVGVISFVVEGWNSSHFAAALSAEYGIGVRDGLFCAHPLVRTLLGSDPQDPGECGAPEAEPGERSLNAIRVSFGAGTPDEHLDRFIGAVRELVTDGARWTYRTEDGRCVPDPGTVPAATAPTG
ncbi:MULTISPECIES: aminotransferase class V-fold PLP-dependent enzyme [Streptomyces]|uniref:Aminotransferase class V-fold PLP-dependent enzyme n=1 Tax=Streptomyces tsukubensis (strain DSM 42081 / NBRC 108919 / NRRL 18488 / 9993) TaxID=1114943 RepID=I2MX00_STRT9|nr:MULTISPECIES: aminotransferase class V-fold PLP-dependent enzyme [Streptomyces]AZK93709.1 cysteine desulfurase [Streptomyces tsukubensis]EIF89297.1 aminotransferase [Streptomyces tsukubensis NRRL18488]MYS64638.1 aminotransferase class V-fold PLP-dependent enzyme [Streptomyces sp. SID5473]QKM70150.1 aminotransferase class V-fold PLP-dependent enzyme [Streptomyces tsukubensis NRRL18488]TAI45870.1 aminotransferase class V-fold PLP-dependent enzyme [Streptomyces tsukubensis]